MRPGHARRDAGGTARRLVWNMRAALNVAALQCQFEPTLLTRANYNAILHDHDDELKTALRHAEQIFHRASNKTQGPARPRSISSARGPIRASRPSSAQYGFCQTAASIGRDALFAPRGGFCSDRRGPHARAAQQPGAVGRAAFPRGIAVSRCQRADMLPRLRRQCWKKGEYRNAPAKCGADP